MNEMTKGVQKTYVERFFGVVVKGQSYLNLFYLLLAFPLGLFYFVFLVTGLSLGVGLLIIWIGIPILLFMLVALWGLTAFERQLAILLLHVDISPMSRETAERRGVWALFKAHLSNPVTWQGLVYLFAKFPLGILSFVVVITSIALTAGLVAAPIIYLLPWGLSSPDVMYTLGVWDVDTLGEALICSIVGIGVGVISLHVMNALAFVLGRFAQLMLGVAESTSVTEGHAVKSEA
ncbi:MAG: sensor domain-containing protein [Planctomycetota bacterium]|jgi:hypothetical protein